jgi:hypothetical protein
MKRLERLSDTADDAGPTPCKIGLLRCHQHWRGDVAAIDDWVDIPQTANGLDDYLREQVERTVLLLLDSPFSQTIDSDLVREIVCRIPVGCAIVGIQPVAMKRGNQGARWRAREVQELYSLRNAAGGSPVIAWNETLWWISRL